MRTLGNILWHFPFLGFVNAMLVYVVGVILTITVIAAPIGLGLMEFGKFLFAPFGHAMVSKDVLNIEQNKLWKTYSTFIMILYLPFGICFCIIAAIQVGFLFISIIGIPMALVIAKSLGTYFNPVNKKCVHEAIAEEIEKRKAQKEISKALGNTPSKLIEKRIEPKQPTISQPTEKTVFCTNCGTKLSQDAKFCENCGSKV